MKIKEIYDFENNRQYTSDKYMIRFIREGTWVEQFETMSDKMKNERERHAKAKERSAKIGRELLND